MKDKAQTFWKTAISIGVSLLILKLMLRLVSYGVDPSDRPHLLIVLLNTSLYLIGLYVVFAFVQAFFRALRYRVLIAAGNEERVPALFHVYLVTVVRNMFVDLLPARLGELSYVAMMNRGCNVSGKTCLSSLAIGFVFDFIALFFIIAGVLTYQLITAGLQGWVISVSIVLLVLVVFMILFVFIGIRLISNILRRIFGKAGQNKAVRRILHFLDEIAFSIEATGKAGVLPLVFLLSLALRVSKYVGLYFMFQAVVMPSFRNLAEVSVLNIISSLLCAEGTAGLPVPSFMSFGIYETGGSLALTLLGFAKAESLIAMLAIHIWSQLVDYTLGGAGFILFLFRTRHYSTSITSETNARKFIPSPLSSPPGGEGRVRGKYMLVTSALLLLFVSMTLMGFQYRKAKKLGAIKPPSQGHEVSIPESGVRMLPDITKKLNGFIVWSSNRFGNHDILMLTLPDLKIVQLTRHPHVDYFPRISPDGSKIVFSRSQHPWVSQRNCFPWDVYLLDLRTGMEKLLAKNGNTPTWGEDGKKVYFQREGNKFVEHNLDTGKEKILFETGTDTLPASVMLQMPSFSSTKESMAVTLRNGHRATAIFHRKGTIREIAGGCQVAWAPDSSYLYYVDKGGRQINAVYKIEADSFERTLWLDLAGDLSHEYFPKVSNDGKYLMLGASSGGHEHDTADYEIFLWEIGTRSEDAVRVTFHTGNDCWPDIYLY